jgi:hypothetical protein
MTGCGCLDTYHITILQMLILMYKNHLLSNHGKNTASLYYMANTSNISIATLYRKSLELMDMGLIDKIDKGHYIITTKGALVLALLYLSGVGGISDDVFRLAIGKLKEDWDLAEFSDDEVISYINLINRGVTRTKTPLVSICAQSLSYTLHYILQEPLSYLNNNKLIMNFIAENLDLPIDKVKVAERVIAKALLEYLPTITLRDGCKVALLLQGDQSRKVTIVKAAMKCRIHGYKLGIDCPIANSLISRILTNGHA